MSKSTVMRRRVWFLFVVCVVLAVSLVLVWVSYPTTTIDAESTFRPPATVLVSRQVIETVVVGRGEMVAGEPFEVEVGLPTVPDVVLEVVRPGDTVVSGDQIVSTIQGGVFVIEGDLPLVRSLANGDSGEDVREVQEALVGLGLLKPNRVSGRYDVATVVALEDLGVVSRRREWMPGIPLGRIVVVPQLPARVVGPNLDRGDVIEGAISLELDFGVPVLQVTVDSNRVSSMEPGSTVVVEQGDERVSAKVISLSTFGEDEGLSLVRFELPETGMVIEGPLSLVVESTGVPVLVVPKGALREGSDGSEASVTVLEPEGVQRLVPVRIGAVGEGLVEIKPVSGEELTEGTRVVVG